MIACDVIAIGAGNDGASNVSVIVPVEISCCTARRWRAAAAWCRAMISRTVSVCRASTRTPSAKCPSADGTPTMVSPLDSGTRTVPATSGEIVTGAHEAGTIATVARLCASR